MILQKEAPESQSQPERDEIDPYIDLQQLENETHDRSDQ